MKCYVRYIGVLDRSERVHAVEFTTGVNVITGKSSTGKSAIIEIFDYCFGNDDFTVPQGVITESAQLFVILLQFPDTDILIARRPNANKVYIKEGSGLESLADFQRVTMPFFEQDYFIRLAEFKKELGRYFGLNLVDVDEDKEDQKYRGDKKSPTPSIRSFTSFMLQHQNLVANKHAIFYRFDEKEKREQAIEHFRIFLGYADQDYFLLTQQLNKLNNELRKIEMLLPRKQEERTRSIEDIDAALREYSAICGQPLLPANGDQIIDHPAQWRDKVAALPLILDGSSDVYMQQLSTLEAERAELVAKMRTLERRRASVRSSIQYAEDYVRQAESIVSPARAVVSVSECPFCHTHHNALENEANQFSKAVEWLNKELRRSPYMRQSFKVDEHQLTEQIDELRAQIHRVETEITDMEVQISDLEKKRSLRDLALKAKLRVELILDTLLSSSISELEEKRKALAEEKKTIDKKLREYDVKKKMDEAREQVEETMANVGSKFEFEQSYHPIQLKLSFDTFDLWHEKSSGKVFLRAMGSGANWLYCHLSLFLALQRLFCSLGERCKIPPILFFDQPSQVYFPSFDVDDGEEFDPHTLADKRGRLRALDDDMQAVQNMYSELVRFCNSTKSDTGIEPQIIVTDHADHLSLAGEIDFEDLVRARWRTRGFIDPVPVHKDESPE